MSSNEVVAIESTAYADEQMVEAHRWLDSAMLWKARGYEDVYRERMEWVESCLNRAAAWYALAKNMNAIKDF